jgi:hypothetical protein
MRLRGLGLLLLLALAPWNMAHAVPVLTGEYKLPASFDHEVTPELVDSRFTTILETEEWARVWRPQADGVYPLVIFLHGNHGTCGYYDPTLHVRIDNDNTYTFDGTCPDGYVVTPNHRGYDYLAADLASHGYVVVSINANRGVTAAPGIPGDWGLNLRRGRLVLRNMEYLSQWNAHGGAPDSLGFQLTGIIDFDHVGLMGHSRGGEGMRAAVAQYRDKGSPWPARIGKVNFDAMFEIGPVDGQTSRVLNNTDMQWNVLLPGCDGDVGDLEGLKPYDRGLEITTEKNAYNKSTFQVFGANHNFFNTEWQESDSPGCVGETALFPQYKGSKAQRTTSHESLIPFFLAHVGANANPAKARMFDPSYPLSAKLTAVTRYARGFSPAPHAQDNFVVDNFDRETGTSSEGVPDESAGLSQYLHGAGSPNDDSSQRAASVNWATQGGFLQVNAAAAGSSADVSAYPALEFRVALRCSGLVCSTDPDPTGDVDFSIALADKNDALSTPVILKDIAAVYRPAGSVYWGDQTIPQTVRIPLSAFAGADPTNIRGVRFTFDRTKASSIYLENVRFTRVAAGPGGLSDSLPPGMLRANAAAPEVLTKPDSNTSAIRTVRDASGNVVEIELTSSRPFPIGDALPVLTIGDRRYRVSRILPGKPSRMVFTLSEAEYGAARDGAAIALRIGAAHPWSFGALRK